MRLIKADRKYNPNKLRFLLSLLISLVFSIYVVLMATKIMSYLINDASEFFDQSCQRVTDGYSQAVSQKIETYIFALDNFLKAGIEHSETPEEFQDFLIKHSNLNHPDFMNVSYVDLTGKGYSQFKKVYDASSRDYYDAIVNQHFSTYVSEPLNSLLNNEPVFIIAKAIKDKNQYLKGFITCSIKLANMTSIVKELLFDQEGYIFIIGDEGKFLSHPNSQYILKTFVPEDKEFATISSMRIAKRKSGQYRTINVYGNPATIYVRPVQHTKWTLGLSIPGTFQANYKKREVHFRFIIIIFSVIGMAVLMGLAYYFTSLLQKHQHIDSIYDSLTSLYTRKRFEHEGQKLMRHNPKAKFMLIESDIRGFKFINQNYGEKIADDMIIYFSHVLNKSTMKHNGIIGRGFADHFYTLYKIPSIRKAMRVFKDEIPWFDERSKNFIIPFSGKFGIAFHMPDSPTDSNSITELINQASFAKNSIKDNLIQNYSIYNSKLLSKINEERFIEAHMEEALSKHEFFVMYQPKISLTTEKIVGAEALVRWQSPTLGLMSPNSFIPLFEKNGFVTKLDFYVYEEVFKFMEKQIAIGNPVVPVSVNMSRNHSKPDKFMHNFLEVFKKYSIPSNLIQIEIIERSMMDNETLKEITENLHKEGFSVAMDDFGTGESSLNMLTKIPVDVLKFDREFLTSSVTKNGGIDKKSADFIEILIEMSKVLDKETVFEGVETQEQRDFLKSINCDEVQGYFYSKPLSAKDFEEFVKLHI